MENKKNKIVRTQAELFQVARYGLRGPGFFRVIDTSAVDINSLDGLGYTAFHLACHSYRNKDVTTLQFLCINGADIDAIDSQGQTPLSAASEWGNVQLVDFLLRNGASILVGNVNGWTPLHFAAMNGHVAVVKRLLRGEESGVAAAVVNVDSTTTAGYTPLTCAAHFGQADVVEVLVGAGANVNHVAEDGITTPLYAASHTGQSHLVDLLITRGAMIDVNMLQVANDNGRWETFKQLAIYCCQAAAKNSVEMPVPLDRVDRLSGLVVSTILLCVVSAMVWFRAKPHNVP
eukprot:scaffold7349_cov173-Amphora_coffeaeformis.AAC.93